MKEQELAALWLSACSGLEPREQSALVERAGSERSAFEEFEKFSAETIKFGKKGLLKKGSAIERQKEAEKTFEKLEKAKVSLVFKGSESYPASLSSIPIAPLVLYAQGNLSLLKERLFSIVGSRKTPPWAEKLACSISESLSEKFAIVSGIAEGGDTAAIKGAINGGKAVCVLPCGIDLCYPTFQESLKGEIKEKGLVLSEYALQVPLKRYSFHQRNRVIAGLSEGVLVVSAAEKSGTLITAGYAADFGRDVFALPYNPGIDQGRGCNELIKRGAYLCTDAGDILTCYGFSAKEKKSVELSESEILILGTLLEGDLHISLISERANLPIYEVSAIISSLELKGLVVKTGANTYCALKP